MSTSERTSQFASKPAPPPVAKEEEPPPKEVQFIPRFKGIVEIDARRRLRMVLSSLEEEGTWSEQGSEEGFDTDQVRDDIMDEGDEFDP
ncbi:hypothetical protein ID866_7630 [Astraeus odoratus]|nr:hypothetical protein ID866_7630 [Astraeus odoratus]